MHLDLVLKLRKFCENLARFSAAFAGNRAPLQGHVQPGLRQESSLPRQGLRPGADRGRDHDARRMHPVERRRPTAR